MQCVFGRDYEGEEDFSMGGPDLKAFSESLGAVAYEVFQPDELLAALESAEKKADSEQKPQVVLIHVDPNELAPFQDRFRSVSHSIEENPSMLG